MVPSTEQMSNIETLAKLVENHGALLIFSIISGIINTYFVIQLARGRLVPYSVYKKVVDDVERLRTTMEHERENFMSKFLGYMGGLKQAGPKEGKEDANGNDQ